MLKTWFLQLFWRWTQPLTFIWNLAKPCEQLFLRKCFCWSILYLVILVLLFCETNLISRKSAFRRNFRWNVGREHLALTAWKRYYSTVRIASVRYLQAEDCNTCLHKSLSTWQLGFTFLSFWYIICIYVIYIWYSPLKDSLKWL